MVATLGVAFWLLDRRSTKAALEAIRGTEINYIGAHALLSNLPEVNRLLGDRGYDADWFREALKDKGIRLYPWPEATEESGEIRQAPVQTPQSDRDHVW